MTCKEPSKRALVTGVTGQDGAYLAELLLDKGYEVHGIKRRASLFNTDRIDHLYKDPHEPDRRFVLHYGDLTDSTNLIRIVQQVQPDEIYNLAAQSFVPTSFTQPVLTGEFTALGVTRILEVFPKSKLIFANHGKYLLEIPAEGQAAVLAESSSREILPLARVMTTQRAARPELVGATTF